jgi:hypothetical protein
MIYKFKNDDVTDISSLDLDDYYNRIDKYFYNDDCGKFRNYNENVGKLEDNGYDEVVDFPYVIINMDHVTNNYNNYFNTFHSIITKQLKNPILSYKDLSDRILDFIDRYAAISIVWDGVTQDEKYTSPDAYQMVYCAEMLSKGEKPKQCFSEWGSCGYRPYLSVKGKEDHDFLVKEIFKIIKS